ncbi:SymE family type I addiction module toxin [Pectobacterium polaris]|uniref:SymE family type I addiction module toxin n=1 Tax=Pectobacterium polaris TaxID=2042057 RepID=UPI002B24A499|nr:SymE family type I addiction module toxin [Pectobacterium polaris]
MPYGQQTCHFRAVTRSVISETSLPGYSLSTITRAANGGKKPPSPQLKLSGKWLEDLDFNTGQPVIVTVERGKLVIETELRF